MGVVNYLTVNGEIVSETRDGVERDYLPDPLGSTAALLDSSGITDPFSYWPYGELRSHTGSTPTPFQYVGTLGYYADADRLYVRARYLQSQYARWLTADPLWPDQKAYKYAMNCPVSYEDHSGLCTASEFEECWRRGFGGCIDEYRTYPFLCWLIHVHVAVCTGTREGHNYRNCRALQAGCYALVRQRPKGWDFRRWYRLCDECYLKCKSSGVVGAISSGCDFWNFVTH